MKKELLIFGANGALGEGVTRTLLQKDYDEVFLFDFNFNDVKTPGKNVKQIIVNDLSKEENVSKAFDKISPGKDKTFFLFSTIGGYLGGKTIWETSDDDIEKMFNINFKTSLFLAKQFSRIVAQSSSGSICFTAAFTGLNPEAKKAAYGISKASLIHLVKTLALEGREIRLSVNAIAPYIIDTKANREWMLVRPLRSEASQSDNVGGKDADFESLMKPDEIGELIHSIFMNYHFVTGNIIELTHRFKV